jgi:hypothetical protein
MKKLLLVCALSIITLPIINGAARSNVGQRIDYTPFLAKLETTDKLVLNPRYSDYNFEGTRNIAESRAASVTSWTLNLDDKEPITGKTYRQLIKTALENGHDYKLRQFISFDPSFKPYPPRYTMNEVPDVVSTFVDAEAWPAYEDTEKTVVDRLGSNLEIEQAQTWLIPGVKALNNDVSFVDAVRDLSGPRHGYIPFIAENPDDISPTANAIALINPTIKTSLPNGTSYPYLVDVLPRATIAEKTGGLTFDTILRNPDFKSPDGQYVIIRTVSWDKTKKKATIQFYDGNTFDSLLDEYMHRGEEESEEGYQTWTPMQFFKIQKFTLDPANPRKAYATHIDFTLLDAHGRDIPKYDFNEIILPGYHGRGRYYFADQNWNSASITRPDGQDFAYARRSR